MRKLWCIALAGLSAHYVLLFAADTRPLIVCFGDSLTAGFGVDPGKSYPDDLQQNLDRAGYHYRVLNRGVSGETTQDGLARLPLLLVEKPQIVVLEFGANDGLRGQPVTLTEAHLAQMIESLQKAGVRVVLAGITLPPNYGPEYIAKFNAMYANLATRFKVPLIPFLLAGVATNPRLMQQDGLHPNTEGTRLVAQTVMRALVPLLRKS
jgi:acyl-CoA thioesterase I